MGLSIDMTCTLGLMEKHVCTTRALLHKQSLYVVALDPFIKVLYAQTLGYYIHA